MPSSISLSVSIAVAPNGPDFAMAVFTTPGVFFQTLLLMSATVLQLSAA